MNWQKKLCKYIVFVHSYPYAAVAELVYGKRMRLLVTVLQNLTVFGAGIPNILVCEPCLSFSITQ